MAKVRKTASKKIKPKSKATTKVKTAKKTKTLTKAKTKQPPKKKTVTSKKPSPKKEKKTTSSKKQTKKAVNIATPVVAKKARGRPKKKPELANTTKSSSIEKELSMEEILKNYKPDLFEPPQRVKSNKRLTARGWLDLYEKRKK